MKPGGRRERKPMILYRCNGEKEDCAKKNCYKNGGYCSHTENIEYAENFIRPSLRSDHWVEADEKEELHGKLQLVLVADEVENKDGSIEMMYEILDRTGKERIGYFRAKERMSGEVADHICKKRGVKSIHYVAFDLEEIENLYPEGASEIFTDTTSSTPASTNTESMAKLSWK
jgi:hypothetical protein